MKTNIKTIIGIIVIAISSISVAQAGQNRHERGHDRSYEKPRQERHYRQNKHRKQWKHTHHHQQRYRGQRHSHKHHYYNRHGHRYIKVKRSHKNHPGWRRHGHRHFNKRFYRYGAYRQSTYVPPDYSSHSVSIKHHGHSDNVLPVLAGSVIGSAIANDASDGDPLATFGGAVFGALVGNAIARH